MSVNTLERALWLLNVDRESKRAFKDNPEAFLSKFRLTDVERDSIARFDVRTLAASGANPMLTMGFWMECEGSRDLAKYLQRMRSVSGEGNHDG